MRIAVCMKQVPAYSEGNMDAETGLLIRKGLESVVNTYDLSALEVALQIKETIEAEIVVFTMGPAQAESVLRVAFAMGADKGCLVCDKAFAGADVLATSYTLMQAIKSEGVFHMILCGKQTTDGDTSLVSGALSKWLEIPGYIGVSKLEVRAENSFRIIQRTGEEEELEIIPPCLLAVERDICIPRMPSLKLKIASRKREIKTITLQDLKENNQNYYGLKGSATRVKKIFPPEKTIRQKLCYWDEEETVESIIKVMEELKVI